MSDTFLPRINSLILSVETLISHIERSAELQALAAAERDEIVAINTLQACIDYLQRLQNTEFAKKKRQLLVAIKEYLQDLRSNPANFRLDDSRIRQLEEELNRVLRAEGVSLPTR